MVKRAVVQRAPSIRFDFCLKVLKIRIPAQECHVGSLHKNGVRIDLCCIDLPNTKLTFAGKQLALSDPEELSLLSGRTVKYKVFCNSMLSA